MWIILLWINLNFAVLPDRYLLAVNKYDCKLTNSIINERKMSLPDDLVAATCVFIPQPSRQ
jgi:hypothetical protein